MNLLQKLFGGTSAKPEKRYYTFTVKCLRCGETLDGRVDLDNDPSVEYEEGGEVYHARNVAGLVAEKAGARLAVVPSDVGATPAARDYFALVDAVLAALAGK